MRSTSALRFAFTTFGAALLFATPVVAQSTLDRTDPSQAEPRELDKPIESKADVGLDRLRIEIDQSVFDDTRYDVGAIVVENLVSLTPDDFADIIQEYSARTLGAGELRVLSDRIAARLRERGYIFASAPIPPQSLAGGVLRIRVDEGIIDEIRIEGDVDRAIIAQLEPLRNGKPVTLARLERQVLLAGDVSGVYLHAPRYEREDDRGVLILKAIRSDFSAGAELTNDGSQPIGPTRARIDINANGLISPFDEVDLTYLTVPTQPGELQYLGGRYTLIVSPKGTDVSVSGSFSAVRPGAYLTSRDIYGKSMRVSARLRHPLRRSRVFSLWIDGELEWRDLRQDWFDELVRHDRTSVVRVGLYGQALMLDGSFRGKLTLSQGLNILDATPLGSSLSSRADAPPDFTALAAWFEWERDLRQSFSVAIAGRGQLSTKPLLVSEETGLGGNDFLRGYNFSERSGDIGLMGSAELRYDWRRPLGLVRRMEVYAYADGGVVGNLEDGRGSGSLASSGGGVRTDITRDLDLNLELAIPLTGPRYDTDDKSPRFNVAVSHSF